MKSKKPASQKHAERTKTLEMAEAVADYKKTLERIEDAAGMGRVDCFYRTTFIADLITTKLRKEGYRVVMHVIHTGAKLTVHW